MNNPLLPDHIVVWNQCFGPHCDGTYDCDNRWIEKADYGKDTPYGWQIDHVWATALGGPDTLSNKRPRHWEGNSRAGGLVGAMIAKSPTNAFHVPSRNTPIANMLATAPPPHSARGLEALANALIQKANPSPAHSALGLANALHGKTR